MALNYDSIGSTTIGSFGDEELRAKILAQLIEEKYAVVEPPEEPTTPPPSGGSIIGGGIQRHNLGPYVGMPPRFPIDDQPAREYEQPFVTVSVKNFFGMEGSETLNITAQMDFVTVTNIEISDPEDEFNITVNIRDLEI